MNVERNDLYTLVRLLDGVINGTTPDIGRQDWTGLRQRLARALDEVGPEHGHKVLEWRIPLIHEHVLARGKNKGKIKKKKQAPTMNELLAMNIWARQEARERLEGLLLTVLESWPSAATLHDKPRPRCVRVTRFSSVQPDEMGADAIGAKLPIDRMVAAGVLAGDTTKHLHREVHWQYAPKNEGALLLEVFELKGPAT